MTVHEHDLGLQHDLATLLSRRRALGLLGGAGLAGPSLPTEAAAGSTAQGVTLTFDLTVLDVSTGGTPLAGAAVYLWHCDQDGKYSLYEEPVLGENYLRGVGVAGAGGKVRFTSIFPGAYDGRWPHAHFEVYASAADATSGGRKLRTSQLALPEDACSAVYATAGYEQSVQNFSGSSLDGDQVFADGYSLQLATVSGTPAAGLTAALTIAV